MEGEATRFAHIAEVRGLAGQGRGFQLTESVEGRGALGKKALDGVAVGGVGGFVEPAEFAVVPLTDGFGGNLGQYAVPGGGHGAPIPRHVIY